MRRAGTLLHGEPLDGRGNGSFRGLLAEPQVRDLRRFLALTLPFPVLRSRPTARMVRLSQQGSVPRAPAVSRSRVFLNEYTGRGVRIAVVDSGVHADHPHVGGVEQGIAIRDDGSLDEDFVDRLGHGTAVTAAIREKSPDAAIITIKVFWRTLSTDVASLVLGIDEGLARGASVINLSLGTSNAAHRSPLQEAVQRTSLRQAVIVAAVEDATEWLPGSLEGVIPVRLDWSCPRHEYRLVAHDGRPAIAASGYPREIPNVPPERNLKGISFAVANASGFVARARQAANTDRLSDIWKALETGARIG